MVVEVFEHLKTGKIMSRQEMEEYCRENYDYGDETNMLTYISNFWEECGFKLRRTVNFPDKEYKIPDEIFRPM